MFLSTPRLQAATLDKSTIKDITDIDKRSWMVELLVELSNYSMASVHRKPRSPFFMAKFRADDGRIVMRSTKQENHAKATRIADEWEQAAKKARGGELTQAAVLKTLGEILERTTGESMEVESVADFLNRWLGKAGKSEGTRKRYTPIITDFLKSLGKSRTQASVGSVTPKEIERFRDGEITAGKSPTTANLALKVLRAAFGEAKRMNQSLSNPAEAVTPLSENDAEERVPFERSQVSALLSVADNEWKGMILLGFHAGLRLGDAANLTWAEIDGRKLTFQEIKTSRRKKASRRDTCIFLHADVAQWLEGLPMGDDPRQPLFPTLHGKTSGSNGEKGGLSNAFSRLMAQAKIRVPLGVKKEGKGRQFKKLGFHSLRHTMISNFANSDVPSDVRKAISGHSSDEIHDRYVHLDLTTQQRAVEKIKSIL